MTSVSGRCHGPGCQVLTDLDFHAAECASAWHGQFWKPVLLAEEEVACGEEEPVLERRFTELPAAPSCPSVVDEIRAAYIQHTGLPDCGPFKMTRWQRDLCLHDAPDGTVRWRSDDTVLELSVVPIELVRTVKESTPYLLRKEARERDLEVAVAAPSGATYQQVAPEYPQVAQSGWRAWFRMRRTR